VKRLDIEQVRAVTVTCGEHSTGITTGELRVSEQEQHHSYTVSCKDRGDGYIWGHQAATDGSDLGVPRRLDEFRQLYVFLGQLALGVEYIVGLADLQLTKVYHLLCRIVHCLTHSL